MPNDAQPTEPLEEPTAPAGLGGTAETTPPRTYGHISRALYERPWALQPAMLNQMVAIFRERADGILVTAEDIDERLAAARAQNGDREGPATVGAVAVIPLYGVISQRMGLMSAMSGGTSIDELRGQLRAALADPAVKAIVFDIDSPGGAVDGVTEFAQELRAARTGQKPIVGVANTLVASCAYWLGSQMSELVATPSAEVGSIGVFAAHEDISGQQAQQGVKTTLISAGPYKTEQSPYEPLSADARAAVQDQVDAFYAMFVSDVAKGRKTSQENVLANYGGGRTLLAKPALAAGMVDRIDTLEATVSRLQPVPAGRRAAAAAPVHAAFAAATNVRDLKAWNQRMKGRLRR